MNSQQSFTAIVDQIMQTGIALEDEEIRKTPTLSELGFSKDFIEKTKKLVKQLMEQERLYQLDKYPKWVPGWPLPKVDNIHDLTKEDIDLMMPGRKMSVQALIIKMQQENQDITPLIEIYEKMNLIFAQITPKLSKIEVQGNLVKIYPEQVISKSIDPNFCNSFYLSRIV